jgi:hypothetical protein
LTTALLLKANDWEEMLKNNGGGGKNYIEATLRAVEYENKTKRIKQEGDEREDKARDSVRGEV